MSKLHQIVAVESGEKQRSAKAVTAAYHKLQKPDLFAGLVRTYAPVEEDGQQQPSDEKQVQYQVSDVIQDFQVALSRIINLTATKDYGNLSATADLLLNGKVIIRACPVPFLLFLEKKLDDVHSFISKIPTLDRAKVWERDDNTNLWKTREEKRISTKKVQRALVMYQATEHHPAQTQMITEDQVQGTWTAVEFSGCIHEVEKQKYLDRVNELKRAVKFARTEANEAEVEDLRLSGEIFNFIFND